MNTADQAIHIEVGSHEFLTLLRELRSPEREALEEKGFSFDPLRLSVDMRCQEALVTLPFHRPNGPLGVFEHKVLLSCIQSAVSWRVFDPYVALSDSLKSSKAVGPSAGNPLLIQPEPKLEPENKNIVVDIQETQMVSSEQTFYYRLEEAVAKAKVLTQRDEQRPVALFITLRSFLDAHLRDSVFKANLRGHGIPFYSDARVGSIALAHGSFELWILDHLSNLNGLLPGYSTRQGVEKDANFLCVLKLKDESWFTYTVADNGELTRSASIFSVGDVVCLKHSGAPQLVVTEVSGRKITAGFMRAKGDFQELELPETCFQLSS